MSMKYCPHMWGAAPINGKGMYRSVHPFVKSHVFPGKECSFFNFLFLCSLGDFPSEKHRIIYIFVSKQSFGIDRVHGVGENDVEFLYDLTFDKDGKKVMDQNIFEKAHSIIDDANEFVVMDMFLFNDEYDRKDSYPGVSSALAQKLIEKKKDRLLMRLNKRLKKLRKKKNCKLLEPLLLGKLRLNKLRNRNV